MFKKIKNLMFCIVFIFSNALYVNAENIKTQIDDRYILMNVESYGNDEKYIQYIFKDQDNSYSYIDNDEIVYHDEYKYLISEKSKARNSASENISAISYALNATVKYEYSQSGSYYKMTKLTVSNISVESGCTFKKVTAYILNNGQSNTKLYTNQSKNSTFYTTSGGTIYGNSSWEYTTSVEHNIVQGTGFVLDFQINRGTGSPTGPWTRYF